MKRKTTISSDLTHITKLIDPRSGKVLREGTTPMATVGDFKTNPTPAEPQVDRVDELEAKMDKGFDEIKALLVKSLEK